VPPTTAGAPRGDERLRAGPNGTGADAAAGRGRRAGQRAAVAARLTLSALADDSVGASVRVATCDTGAEVVVATQQSLEVITGVLTTVQPQPVRQ